MEVTFTPAAAAAMPQAAAAARCPASALARRQTQTTPAAGPALHGCLLLIYCQILALPCLSSFVYTPAARSHKRPVTCCFRSSYDCQLCCIHCRASGERHVRFTEEAEAHAVKDDDSSHRVHGSTLNGVLIIESQTSAVESLNVEDRHQP